MVLIIILAVVIVAFGLVIWHDRTHGPNGNYF